MKCRYLSLALLVVPSAWAWAQTHESAAAVAAAAAPVFPFPSTFSMWIGTTCAGALIALAGVVVAQRLRNAREMAALRHSVAASADWWWRTDAQLVVQEVQPSRRPLTWLNCQTLVGRKPWQISAQDVDVADIAPVLMQAIAARAPFFDVIINVDLDGQTRPITLSGAPLFTSTGSFMGYAGTCRDLTPVVQSLSGAAPSSSFASISPALSSAKAAQDSAGHERELARLRNSFAERSRAYELAIKDLDSFAHSVSHDLRAPLRVVDGFAHIVLEDYAETGRPLDDLGRDHLKRIVSAGQRMNGMIETLLSMARMTGKELARSEVDLSALARDIAEELQTQQSVALQRQNGTEPATAAAASVSQAPQFVIAPNVVVEGDSSLLGGVMQNLLSNAWKFSSRTAAPRIEFGVRRPSEHAGHSAHNEYFVRDNGAGFDMRFADKLFGLFQRFHSANEYPGTGVGLATVQRIVRKHGGRIWAESTPGQGATFYFTLWEHFRESPVEAKPLEARPSTSPLKTKPPTTIEAASMKLDNPA